MKYKQIIIGSGGQIGVDRAALDFVMNHNYKHGGFCPAGRKAEDGIIPSCYNLAELFDSGYDARTKMNVFRLNGILIIF